MYFGARGAKRVRRRRAGKEGCGGAGRYCPAPDSGDCAGSSCRASHALSSAPAAARPTAPGNTRVRMWSRASSMRPCRCRPPRRTLRASRARARRGSGRRAARAPGRGRGRRPCGRRGGPPPSDPSRPVIVRPTNPGARSDTTPMAILPPAKLIARSLPSIDRIVRDQRSAATSPTASEDGPQPLSGRSAVPDSRLRDRTPRRRASVTRGRIDPHARAFFRRESQPTSAPSRSPASGAKGTSVVTLT